MRDLQANPPQTRFNQFVPAVPTPHRQDSPWTGDRRLLLVLGMLEANMRRQVAIEELATAVNLSSGRLAHLFKSEFGVSPHRYLNNLRLEKARGLLESAALNGKEIAAAVGIPNASRFCRSFKERYGITPKEYRQTYLKIDLPSLSLASLPAIVAYDTP
jgi:transcriptional regulator GlxA family with amidase domain